MRNPKHITVKQYSSKRLLRLIRRVLKQIPENDTLGYRQRQMAIDWHEVAFGLMDWKECRRVSLLLVRKAQSLQTLPGLLEIAKEAITKMEEGGQNESAPPTVSKEIKKLDRQKQDLRRAYGSYIRIKLKGVPVDERRDVRISYRAEWEAMSVDDKLSYLPKKREKKNDGPRSPPAKLYNFFINRYIKALDSSTDRKEALKQASNSWRGLSAIDKLEQKRLWEKAHQRYAKRYRAFLETLPPEEKEAKLQLETNKGKIKIETSKQDKIKMKPLRIEAGRQYREQKKVIADLMRTCPQKPPKTLYNFFKRSFAKAQAGEKPQNEMSKASKAWKEITEDERARLKHHFSKAQQRYMKMQAIYLNALHEENEKLDQLKNQCSENPNESTILSNSLIQDDTADVTVEPEEDFDRLDDTSNLQIEVDGQVDSMAELTFEDLSPIWTDPEEHTASFSASPTKAKKEKRSEEESYQENSIANDINVWTDPEEHTESLSASPTKAKNKKLSEEETYQENCIKNDESVWTDPEDHTESFSASLTKTKKKKRSEEEIYQANDKSDTEGNGKHTPLKDPVEPLKKKKKRRKSHHSEENNLENSDGTTAKKKKLSEEEAYQEDSIENETSYNERNEKHTPLKAPVESPKKKKKRKKHNFEENSLENSDCVRIDPEEHTESFSASLTTAKKKKLSQEETYQEDSIENETRKKKKRKKSRHSEENNLENSDCARTDPEEHTESFSASPYNERNEKHTPLEAPVEPPKTPMNLFLRNNPEMTEQDWTELSEKKKKYYQKALKRLQQVFMVQYEGYLATLPRESLAEHVLRMRNES